MPEVTLTIPFAADSGEGEARWIRLEQVETPDEGATMAQAAALVDALYGIEPCVDGMGGGGAAADEDALPEEAEFLTLARERLDLGVCRDDPHWTAEVDVLRSHQDDGCRLEAGAATIMETAVIEKDVTETVEMNGATCDLSWPCRSVISVSGAGAELLDARGSTVNFRAPVRGRARIRYRAVWERVKLRVRRGEEAAVIAFWRDLAAECVLREPPAEDGLDAAEIRRICDPDNNLTVKGECWRTIENYNLCKCSGREAPDAPEPVDETAPCPEGVRPGSWLGTERRPGGYVDCEGEGEGLDDPDAYFRRCCQSPPYALPACRETREPYRGGAEIEYGPEHWRNIYGENVRLIPVSPEGGNCGELVRVWAAPKERDCGEGPGPGPGPGPGEEPEPGTPEWVEKYGTGYAWYWIDRKDPVTKEERWPYSSDDVPGAPWTYSPVPYSAADPDSYVVVRYDCPPFDRNSIVTRIVSVRGEAIATRGRYGALLRTSCPPFIGWFDNDKPDEDWDWLSDYPSDYPSGISNYKDFVMDMVRLRCGQEGTAEERRLWARVVASLAHVKADLWRYTNPKSGYSHIEGVSAHVNRDGIYYYTKCGDREQDGNRYPVYP